MRPPVEQRDVVHILAQDVELVRADQHARSGVGALAQPTHQTLLGERVETDEGLVQDVDVRRVGEGAGDHEVLLLAAGQLLGASRRLIAQLDGRQSIGRRRPGAPAAETARGSAKSVGGCLISRGSGVLVRVRRDPHGDDEGVYSIPSPARSRRHVIFHHDRSVAPAPGPGS